MKKVLLTLILMVSALSAFAQRWDISSTEADELLNKPATTTYWYRDVLGSFVFSTYPENIIKLNTSLGIFDYGPTSRRLFATVGLYDASGSLVKSVKILMLCRGGEESAAYTFDAKKDKKVSKEVIDYIKAGNGYVRVVAPIYGGGNYDIKIPCLTGDE